jgi:hypothetical protein
MQALIRDDFMTLEQIRTTTGAGRHTLEVALDHMRKRRAVAAMEVDGTLWWYATPGEDNRSRVVEERAVEHLPRRRRRTKANKGETK